MSSSQAGSNLLKGKRILITGLLSNRSIAYGIAKTCFQQGAELAFTYQSHDSTSGEEERFEERVTNLAREFSATAVLPCNVASDSSIQTAFAQLKSHWDRLDGLVHAIAFAPRSALSAGFLEGASRSAFQISQDVSTYSFISLAHAAKPLMQSGGSLLTLSYLGGRRVVPNYNLMGLAKASLEASVWYLANELGADGIRVNAISPGPVKTLAASGIQGFSKIMAHVAQNAPLRRNVTLEDIGRAAAFFLSDWSSGITGEITYVDGGFNKVMGGLS